MAFLNLYCYGESGPLIISDRGESVAIWRDVFGRNKGY
ncbi:hypothetical protein HMPREF1144_5449 [Klebsiella sp. OBRC7]|nr:hypothetical protein HMPREF1144_5449 [Klebsiella sp. OBRC7]